MNPGALLLKKLGQVVFTLRLLLLLQIAVTLAYARYYVTGHKPRFIHIRWWLQGVPPNPFT